MAISAMVLAVALWFCSLSHAAAGSPSSSTLDIHIEPGAIEITLVVHISDVAHDLAISPPERLLDADVLARQGDAVVWLLKQRLQIAAGIHSLGEGSWSTPEALTEQQSIRLRAHYDVGGPPGIVSIDAKLFPYDRAHQTFLNIYEADTLEAEAVLDRSHPRFLYFEGS